MMTNRTQFAALVTTAMVSSMAASPAFAQATVNFNLPAQELSKSLKDVARATNTNVVFDPAQTRGKQAPALSGQFDAETAIARLIAGQALTEKSTGSGTFVISGSAPQGNAGAAGAAAIQSAATGENSEQAIVVTGTNIRGVAPVGSPFAVYTRKDIEQSGAVTLEQFARHIAGNFSSSDPLANTASNAHKFVLFGTDTNQFVGASFNLRGLGPSSTLTLIDGHRIAPAGAAGAFTDISLLPLSFIDRVEVLPDGASAIYGADAVGGVVNIITRKSYEGAETTLRYSTSDDGGATEYSVAQLAGHNWPTGNLLLAYEFDRDEGLDASKRSYIPNLGGPYLIIPKDHRNSAIGSIRQDIGDWELFGRVLYGKRAFDSVNTLVSIPTKQTQFKDGSVSQFNAVAGLRKSLGAGWQGELTASYSRVHQAQETDSVFVLPPIGTRSLITADNTRESALDGRFDGPLFNFPGGPVKAAVGFDLRKDSYAQNAAASIDKSRRVYSAFAELFAPLVSPDQQLPLVRSLDLSAAVRYDKYSDFGSTTNPKVGVDWSPAKGLHIEGSAGTSYQAPLLSQLGQVTQTNTFIVPTTISPTTDLLLISGGNPDLTPQKASTYTAGVKFEGPGTTAFVASIDYYNIHYRDQIGTPPFRNTSDAFTNPIDAPFRTINPSLSSVQALFASPFFVLDGAARGPAGVQAIFDDRLLNIATTKEDGLEYKISYRKDVAGGRISAALTVDQILNMKVQTTPAQAFFGLANTIGEPVKWHGTANLGWESGALSASATFNYTGHYRDSLFTPSRTIKAWKTLDLYAAYDLGKGSGSRFLKGLKLSLSVVNVTNERPPFLAIPATSLLPGQAAIPFDESNSNPIGRQWTVTLTKGW